MLNVFDKNSFSVRQRSLCLTPFLYGVAFVRMDHLWVGIQSCVPYVAGESGLRFWLIEYLNTVAVEKRPDDRKGP